MQSPWTKAAWIAPFAVAIALGAAFSIWMALLGESAGHVLLMGIAVCAAPFVVSFLLLALLLTPEQDRVGRMKFAAFATLASALCIAAVQVPGCLAANSVREGQIAEAKVWCESLATKIEDRRRDQGAYPESIQGSALVAGAPELCDPRWLYRRNDDASFEIRFYTGFDAQWTWRSRDGSWRYSN